MSAEENKAAIRGFAGQIKLESVDQFVSDDVVYRDAPGLATGIEGYRQMIGMFVTAFPDRGEFMGLPPTGNPMKVSGMSVQRFRDGRVAEGWEVVDMMTMMQQLGAMPAPEQTPA